MVKLDTRRNGGKPIPLPRLINMTYSLDRCMVAGNILSDTNLGKFLYENDFLEESDAAMIEKRVESDRPVSSFFAAIGKEHREAVNGYLTSSGLYLEWDGDVAEMYKPGGTPFFDHTIAPVVLELSHEGKTTLLDLPGLAGAKGAEAIRSLDIFGVKSCVYRCADCVVPAAKEWIDEAKDVFAAARYAKELDRMVRAGGIAEHKALLAVAQCGDLETAIELAKNIGEYVLDKNCVNYADYAKSELESRLPESLKNAELAKYVDLYGFGVKLSKTENMALTDYGLLYRKDGGPLLSQSDAPGMRMSMIME
jgi:hypothetical protein